MKLITVHEQEEGQKLLKLLGSYLKEAFLAAFSIKCFGRKILH